MYKYHITTLLTMSCCVYGSNPTETFQLFVHNISWDTSDPIIIPSNGKYSDILRAYKNTLTDELQKASSSCTEGNANCSSASADAFAARRSMYFYRLADNSQYFPLLGIIIGSEVSQEIL